MKLEIYKKLEILYGVTSPYVDIPTVYIGHFIRIYCDLLLLIVMSRYFYEMLTEFGEYDTSAAHLS